MAAFTPDMPIMKRVEILEAALAKVLDRDETMCVEPWGLDGPHVYVLEKLYDDSRRAHDIHQMARELEVLLS